MVLVLYARSRPAIEQTHVHDREPRNHHGRAHRAEDATPMRRDHHALLLAQRIADGPDDVTAPDQLAEHGVHVEDAALLGADPTRLVDQLRLTHVYPCPALHLQRDQEVSHAV